MEQWKNMGMWEYQEMNTNMKQPLFWVGQQQVENSQASVLTCGILLNEPISFGSGNIVTSNLLGCLRYSFTKLEKHRIPWDNSPYHDSREITVRSLQFIQTSCPGFLMFPH